MIRQFAQRLTEFIGNPEDLQVRLFPTDDDPKPQAVLLYLSSITDETKINALWTQPIVDEWLTQGTVPDFAKIAAAQGISVNGRAVDPKVPTVARQLFEAKCVLLANGSGKAVAIDVPQWNNRSVTAPEIEHSIIGPRDAFVEDIQINLSMIRRRIRHEDLRVETFTVGVKSQTKTNLVYMGGLVNRQVLDRIKERIQAIELDVLLDVTQLGHLLTTKSIPFNPFPLFQTTERPDKVVASLMEGRVLLLADTTPTGALFPATVSALYQTTDDYYFPSLSGTFIRLVRYIGLVTTLILPGAYVSLTSVNYEVFRIQFMLAVAASREGIPYPSYVEVLIMMVLLELINEATVRLPKVIGGTATIVGALILGTSAAQSHLVSNIMIVVTGAVAIGSFTVANYMIGVAWRICSYALMVLAIPWGLNGMALGMTFILLYLSHLKSLGVPYLSPLSTFQIREILADALLRMPITMNSLRPSTYSSSAKGTRRLRESKGEDAL